MRVGIFYPDIHATGGYPRDIARLCAAIGSCAGVEAVPIPSRAGGALSAPTMTAAFGLLPEFARSLQGLDLVHIFGMFFPGYPMLGSLARRHGIPYVVSPMCALLPAALERSRLKKKLFFRMGGLRFLRQATCLHAFAEDEAQSFRALGLEGRVIRHPLGLFPEDLPVDLPSLPRVLDGRFLFCFGRLDMVQKGIDYLLEEFEEYVKQGGRLNLALAGKSWNGSHQLIRHQIAESGLEKRLLFLGEISLEAKYALLRDCAAFVYPTRHDGPPRPIREALAMRKRVLITHEANIHDAVEACGWGYRFHPRPGELCQAICALESESEPPLYRDPMEELSWERLARDMVSSYACILSACLGAAGARPAPSVA